MKRLLEFRSIVTSVLVLSLLGALFFTTVFPARYSFYGDNIECGEGAGIEHNLTLTAHLFLTNPLPEGNDRERVVNSIGTCPYDTYFSKTFALELWLLAGISYYGLRKYNNVKTVEKAHDEA